MNPGSTIVARRVRMFALALALACAASPIAHAAPRPIRVTVVDSLDLGRVVAGARGSSVTLDPETQALRAVGGSGTAGGISRAARFRLRGEPGARFVVSVPSQVRLTGLGGSVVLRDLQLAPGRTGTFDADGRADLVVGGTLESGGAVAGGGYHGSIDVLVDYAAGVR